MGAFEDFVNLELPLRVDVSSEPTQNNYARFKGFAIGGRGVEERTPAEVLSDIGAAASDHSSRHENGGADEISVAGLSGLLADDQNPTAHASEHTDGTDDIQDATDSQKGLMTAAFASKLDGIEASADVTDATNVDAAGAVMESDYGTTGDILYASGAATPSALGIGTEGHVLTVSSGVPAWAASSGGVSGPVSSTDHAIARWYGVGGGTLQDSDTTLDDSENLTGLANVGMSGDILDANGNELIDLGTTASAVNQVKISNAATTVGPTIEAEGETNVDLTVKSKGSGQTIVGLAGDIELGDDTERDMYPNTDGKVNLGTSSKNFHDLYLGGDNVYMYNLPTSDPVSAGALWSDSGTLKVSSG